MPLFPPVSRYSASNSKSPGAPPRQIRNVFCFGIAPCLVSPTMAPFSTRQNAGSPSQPCKVLPSKIGVCADAIAAAASVIAASLRLRNAQAKRIEHPIFRAHINPAATNRERAEVRESANRVAAGEQHVSGCGIQRVEHRVPSLSLAIRGIQQIAASSELHRRIA